MTLSLLKARGSLQKAAELSDAKTREDIRGKLSRIESALGVAAELPSSNQDSKAVMPASKPNLDLASIMNNPMFQQMASSLGGQGGGGLDFAAMMNNPAIQQMMGSLGQMMAGAGGQPATPAGEATDAPGNSAPGEVAPALPDMNALLNDPTISQMANNPAFASLFSPEMMSQMESLFGGAANQQPPNNS